MPLSARIYDDRTCAGKPCYWVDVVDDYEVTDQMSFEDKAQAFAEAAALVGNGLILEFSLSGELVTTHNVVGGVLAMRLSPQAYDDMASTCANPPEPTDGLRKLARES